MVWACFEKREIGDRKTVYENERRKGRLKNTWFNAVKSNMRNAGVCALVLRQIVWERRFRTRVADPKIVGNECEGDEDDYYYF